MKIEDVAVGDVVEALCSKCDGTHEWVIYSLNAPRLSMSGVDGKQTCGLNAQFVYPVRISHVVRKAGVVA